METLKIVGQHLVLAGMVIAILRAAINTARVIDWFEMGLWKTALSRTAAVLILAAIATIALHMMRAWGGPVWFLELLK